MEQYYQVYCCRCASPVLVPSREVTRSRDEVVMSISAGWNETGPGG